jgi:polyisoprenoid-binding protein YceI
MNKLAPISRFCAIACISLLTLAANAAAVDAKSSVTVVFKQMNVPVEGKFKQVKADIHFDPAHIAAASARIDIDVASFDIGSAEYNKTVAGADWFNAAAYPLASFVSTEIKPAGSGYNVAGTLKIKGKSANVVIPVQYRKEGGAQVFDGSLPIKRLQYDIGAGEWKDTSLVADEVQIKFHLVVPAQ